MRDSEREKDTELGSPMKNLPTEILIEIFENICTSPKEWSVLRCVCHDFRELANEVFAFCVRERRDCFQVGGPFVSSVDLEGKENILDVYRKKYDEWKEVLDGRRSQRTFQFPTPDLIAFNEERDATLDGCVAVNVIRVEISSEWSHHNQWARCAIIAYLERCANALHKKPCELLARPLGFVHIAHPTRGGCRLALLAMPVTTYEETLESYFTRLTRQKCWKELEKTRVLEEIRRLSLDIVSAALACGRNALPIRHVNMYGVHIRAQRDSDGYRRCTVYDWWIDVSPAKRFKRDKCEQANWAQALVPSVCRIPTKIGYDGDRCRDFSPLGLVGQFLARPIASLLFHLHSFDHPNQLLWKQYDLSSLTADPRRDELPNYLQQIVYKGGRDDCSECDLTVFKSLLENPAVDSIFS